MLQQILILKNSLIQTDITNEPYFDEAVQELMQYDKSREVFLRVLKQTKAA
jgi:hypothetical protein